ncbi:MAG: peptidoglycan editing factor PgeF [Paramuribaculum sp.]|nr:peptidoglycan editing factor PgeF [Paramuribaculum sp.]
MKVIDLLGIPGITAFSTLRDTDSPSEPYSGFSTCSYTGDSYAHYDGCRKELAGYLGISAGKIVFPHQTHSVNVAVVTDTDAHLPDTDAIVTAMRGVALGIHTADCVPIVLADPESGVIGAAHSGWRGTAGDIAARTVAKMVEIGAKPGNIVAAMGPCICRDCFEVGEEVAVHFNRFGAVDRSRSKPHVDLPLAVAASLENAGVSRERISMPPACSRCNPSDFFSARRLGTASGRTLTLVQLHDY